MLARQTVSCRSSLCTSSHQLQQSAQNTSDVPSIVVTSVMGSFHRQAETFVGSIESHLMAASDGGSEE